MTNMPRREFLRYAGLSVLGFSILGKTAQALEKSTAPRPNIIFILSDDVGWGDFQCYNPQGKIPTPNLNRMAREGMRFTDAHTPAALCAPTRYTVVTGNYTWRGRLPGGTWGWNQDPQFLPGQKTVGHMLQEAGYRTSLYGKLHYGGVFEKNAAGEEDFTKPMKVGPKEWGFDYSYVLLGGHQAPPYCFMENNSVDGDATKITQLKSGKLNGGMVNAAGPGLPDWDSRRVGETLLTKALAFMDADKSKPFYIHMCTDGAHSPYTPPDMITGTAVKGESKMSEHTDMVYEVEVLAGKFIEALEKRGLMENTLLIVTSDNGGIPTNRFQGHDAVGGLRGSKSAIFEGGHRVPFLAMWKGHVPAGTVRNQLVGMHDVVPTFVELAGGKAGPDQMLDSVSLAAVLLGQRGDDQPVRQTLLIQSGGGRDAFSSGAIADEDEKKIPTKQRNQERHKLANAGEKSGSNGMSHALREGSWKLTFDIAGDKPVALYNLADDLAEQKNLIEDAVQAARVKRMEKIYRTIRSSKRSTPVLR